MVEKRADIYGHCVSCGKNLIQERVVDNKVIKMMSPEHEETAFLLDDGSQMRVCTCKDCKNSFKEEDHEQIMENVVAGWKIEVDALVLDESKPRWTKERGDKYMEDYGKKQILGKL